jgi:hypothetical protein
MHNSGWNRYLNWLYNHRGTQCGHYVELRYYIMGTAVAGSTNQLTVWGIGYGHWTHSLE